MKTQNTQPKASETAEVLRNSWIFQPHGTNQLAGGPRYRFGKARTSNCQCDYSFTCGACLSSIGPTK